MPSALHARTGHLADVLVVSVARPNIRSDLNSRTETPEWVVSAYLLGARRSSALAGGVASSWLMRRST
jgi:hypothetical protein